MVVVAGGGGEVRPMVAEWSGLDWRGVVMGGAVVNQVACVLLYNYNTDTVTL